MLRMLNTRNITPKVYKSMQNGQVRNLWEFVNMMFNKPDPARIKLVGPDRACAEWVLRNGGAVKWASGDTLADYNHLPPENVKRTLVEIDGSNSAISHYGFPHLAGCNHLKKIILHNSKYIENEALKGLSYGKDTLTHVQVSHCADVDDSGVKEMEKLQKLESLVIYGLASVKDLKECEYYLKSKLPKCNIQTNQPLKQEASNGIKR